MTRQAHMFPQGQDLPLFSQSPQRAKAQAYQPRAYHAQGSLAQCRICFDTGKVEGKYCTCAAGTRARIADREETRS